MPPTQTHKHRLIDERLHALELPSLAARVDDLRARGVSWRAIAASVAAATGVDCSDTNLQHWFDEGNPQ